MYHKIKNVEKSVCTCEQKVAYELAFLAGMQYREAYREASTAILKDEIAREAIRYCMKRNDKTKYDKDMIFCALNAGIKKYFEGKQTILNYYEDIGKMFPANYL